MLLNLGTCCSLATTLAGNRNDWALSEASTWANLALEQVCQAAGAYHAPLEGLAVSSTTSGGNRIALPSDFDFPIAVTLYQGSTSTATTSRTTTAIPLKQRDSAWVDAQANQFNGGIPDTYVLYGTWAELYPSPDSSYSLQLRYSTKQATLVQSTDTPSLDARWHQAWLYKTQELLEASRLNPQGESLARNRYLNYVSTIRTDNAQRQQDRRSMTLRPPISRRRLD